MTLLTRHIEAGWHEVQTFGSCVAEKLHSQPGATSTTLREEAPTSAELSAKLDLRETQLSNDQHIVIYPDGERVSDSQHSANQINGTAPAPSQGAPGDAGVPNLELQAAAAALSPEDEAEVARQAAEAQVAEAEAAQAKADADEVARVEAERVQAEADALAAQNSPPSEPAPADTPLTDEERAKLRADEAELEDGKIDGVEPPLELTPPAAPEVEPPAAA